MLGLCANARALTTKIQICGSFHQTLLKNEEFLLEEIRVFVPQYACEIIKAKHRQVSMVTLSACCGGEIALSHSYGSYSHDNVGEPKQ